MSTHIPWRVYALSDENDRPSSIGNPFPLRGEVFFDNREERLLACYGCMRATGGSTPTQPQQNLW